MIDHEEAIEAAKVIREYCKERTNCYECMFGVPRECWGCDCALNADCACEHWDLKEAERICHGSGKSN